VDLILLDRLIKYPAKKTTGSIMAIRSMELGVGKPEVMSGSGFLITVKVPVSKKEGRSRHL
jgi:hypothetical protein